MSILTKRDYYKPFSHPWAFDRFVQARKMDWDVEEVPLSEDIIDWNQKLSDNERNLLTQLFRFFTQGDVDIQCAYLDRYIPAFPVPEIRMMLTQFAAQESNHEYAYSLLLDTIGMAETEYQAFHEFDAMRAKHEFLFTERLRGNSVKKLALDLAVFSAFGEGMQLFSSFAILMSFQRRGLMKGMSTIVEWSIRDESLHVESMIELFHALIAEHPEIWTDAFKAHIYQACRDMVDLEDAFIDLAFEMGSIPGVTPAECKDYIRYIADRRLLQLGLKPNYGVTVNPFDWLDWIMNAETHTNFFENRSTEYSKGGVVNWDNAFAFIDEAGDPPKGRKQVIVYGKTDCPYCHLVKDGLTRIGETFIYICLDSDTDRRLFYENSLTNAVPQVYLTDEEFSVTNPSGEAMGGWDNFEKITNRIRDIR
jgi:ribonucleoside-diphosphate reductase beta chain